MTTQVRKQVYLPAEGDMLTDGKRLVEVLAKTRHGYEVLDVRTPTEVGPDKRDPRSTEILTTEETVKNWRKVTPTQEFDDAA